MLSLRIEYRRAFVGAFWMVAATVLFAAIALAAVAIAAPRPLAWGVAGAAAAILPGVVWRPWFESGVWVWNGSTQRASAVLRAYSLAVGYYLLVVPLGLSGSSLDLVAPRAGRSGWTARDGEPLKPGNRGPLDRRAWQVLCSFARRPGNRWTFCLVPLVFLLSILRDEQQEKTLPGSTYTLY